MGRVENKGLSAGRESHEAGVRLFVMFFFLNYFPAEATKGAA